MSDMIERCARDHWMPIATAPKDRPIFFWSEEEGRQYGWYSKSCFISPSDRDDQGGAWVIDDPRNYWITFNPTHWHDLPEPPVAALSQDTHSLPLKPQEAVKPAVETPQAPAAGTNSEAQP